MDAMERMKDSRRRIMLKHGEFNPILLRLALIEDTSEKNLYGTGYTDGKVLAFHPAFLDQLDKDQIDTFQLHECFHVAFLHCFSQRTKWLREEDLMLFFEAEDHVVNNLLAEAGFKALPANFWICNTDYAGWSLEQVFEDLKKRGKKAKQTVDAHFQAADESTMNEEEKAEFRKAQKEWQKALADVITIAKQKGTLGANMQKMVDEALESVIPWTRILVNNLHRRMGRTEATWSRPSRRGRVLDMYLPSTYDLQVDCVVFIFDTSGSMWGDPLLPQGFSELKALCNQMRVKRTVLIEADEAVSREEEVEDVTLLSTEIKGGGGTSFVHALKAAEAYEPTLTVYFTDLAGTFPEDYPYPLIWVTHEDSQAPIGETMKI